jgi:DNA invertase Pin-like site-specific DNA recombinase
LKFYACYIRKSVIDDETTKSPARQRENISRVIPPGCAARWYEDLDISGRYEAKRPGWLRLLSDLNDPDCAGVACESLDRIYRNRTEFGLFKARLESTGQRLIIADAIGIDGSTAAGNLFLGMTAEVAEFESRVASERMTATIRYKQEIIGQHFGRFPFGCDRHPETKLLIPSTLSYWLDPLTGEAGPLPDPQSPPPGCECRYYFDALRTLYDLYTGGEMACAAVAKSLNTGGWRHWGKRRQSPQLFYYDLVRDILRLWPLYAGGLPPARTKRSPRRVALPGGHGPILPVELCRQVGEVMERRARHRTVTRRGNHIYLLTGLLYCGECGEIMTGQTYHGNGRTYYYYRHRYSKLSCSQSMIETGKLDDQILDVLRSFNERLLPEIEAELTALLEQTSTEPDTAIVQLQTKKAEQERLIDAYQSGLITREQFASRQAPLQAHIEQLEAETAATPAHNAAKIQELLPILMGQLSHLEKADSYLLKEIVYNLFERLEVRDNQIANFFPRPWAASILCIDGVKVRFTPQYTNHS